MLIFESIIQIINECFLLSIFLYYINTKTTFYKNERFFRYFIVVILISSELPIFPISYSILSSFLYYAYLILFSQETFFKKTWLYIKFLIGITFSYSFIKFFIMQVFDWFHVRTNSFYDDIKNLFIYLFIYIFCHLIFTPTQKFAKKGFSPMPYYKKLLLALFALPTILLCVAAYLFNTDDTSINTSMLILILIIVAITIFILLLTMSTNFFEQEQQRHLLEQMLQQREMDLTYYEDVSNAILQVSKLRHDFKNHLILIYNYVERQEYKLAIYYINRIIELSHSPVEEVFTNNEAVSAVLNVKRTKCLESNIPLKLNLSFPKIYQLEEIHIVAILGNLLDNAITATSKLTENERIIALSIRQVGTYIDITCENSFDGNILIDTNGRLKSTKTTRGTQNGLGLLNVKDAVYKYDGEFNINYDNGMFTVQILIPNHD